MAFVREAHLSAGIRYGSACYGIYTAVISERCFREILPHDHLDKELAHHVPMASWQRDLEPYFHTEIDHKNNNDSKSDS